MRGAGLARDERYRTGQLVKHLFHAGDHPIEIDGLQLEDLLSAVGEELARQIGRAIRGLSNLGRMVAEQIPRRQIGQQQFAVPDDRGENAVEFVRDSTRELPTVSNSRDCANRRSRSMRPTN
jgi:hypothetical protein